MREAVVVLCCLALRLAGWTGASGAAEPELSLWGPGGQTCGYDWGHLGLDEPDFLATIVSSEVINDRGLVTEIANDFIIEIPVTLRKVSWWGAYWNGFEGTPNGSGFNLRFYFDAEGVPETVPFVEYLLPDDTCAESLSPDCLGMSEFQYVYEHCLELQLEPSLYWLSVQMVDHGFGPQWGRLGSDLTQIHPSCMRSEYFGHSEWVLLVDVVGSQYDASQMLEDECVPVPTEKVSWGVVKGLYW